MEFSTFSSFSKLPTDVQNIILCLNRNTLWNAQYVSKRAKSITQRSFYRDFCMKLPSRKEISQYFNEYPSKCVVIYEEVEDVVNHELITFMEADPLIGVKDRYKCEGCYFNFGSNYISKFSHISDTTDDDFVPFNIFEIDYVDLQSVSSIAKTRTSAMNINKNFPNELSLKYLDHMVNLYTPSAADNILWQYMKFAQLYSYLRLNMKLLDLIKVTCAPMFDYDYILTNPAPNNELLSEKIGLIKQYIDFAVPELKSYFTPLPIPETR